MKRVATLGLTALLSLGCSFLQSWGDLRDGEGMDAGPDVDGGGGGDDAGFDADTDCNDCDLEGCGAGSPDCVYAGPPIDCFVCDLGSVEGDVCDSDAECADDLICEMGFCLYDCDGRSCAESLIGDYCGAPDTDRMSRVCVDDDRDCNPFASTCGDNQPCTLVPDPNNATRDVGTFCARSDNPVQPLMACTLVGPGNRVDRCTDGYTCVAEPPGGETGVCRQYCSVVNPVCMGPEECIPLLGPGGLRFTYQGEEVGFCRPPMIECTDDRACEGNRFGEVCSNGRCGECDPTRPTCNPDTECVDRDGDMRPECIPLFECSNASDCTTVGGAPLCINNLCFARCVAAADCNMVGLADCITYQGNQVCVNPCDGTGLCRNGTACANYDRVGTLDCRLP